MRLAQPTNFQVKLSSCGLDTCNGNYKVIKEKNALELLIKATDIMSRDFVREHHLKLKLDLAFTILNDLTGWDESKVKDLIEKSEERVKNWEMKTTLTK